MLAARRQKSDETLAEFLQSLKELSEDCKFEAVTGEQYRTEMVRDSFINGKVSLTIRQRLLETEDLNLERAYNLALALNRAQEHSLQYHHSTGSIAVAATKKATSIESNEEVFPFLEQQHLPDSTSSANKRKLAVNSAVKQCFFCGEKFHPRPHVQLKIQNASNVGKEDILPWFVKEKILHPQLPVLHHKDHQLSRRPVLSSITTGSPECLQPSIIITMVNGQPADTLIDSGFSACFISDMA